MAHGDGVVRIAVDAASNRVASVLSSLDPTWRHSKIDHLFPKEKKKQRLENWKCIRIESGVCFHSDFLNSKLDIVIPDFIVFVTKWSLF